MIIWTEQFATGSGALDQQHRVLINNLNLLESMLTETNPSREQGEFLIHLVDFLESYARTHFSFEEQCMEKYRCPAHARNKLEHEQFMEFLREFKERCRAEGLRVDVLQGLYQRLGSWVEEHILKVDTRLKPCIRG